MYQHSKKSLFAILLLISVLCLTGCPNDDNGSAGGGDGSSLGGSSGGGSDSIISTPPVAPPANEAEALPGTDLPWHNSDGCPKNQPVALQYPENGDLYTGLAICYSGSGPTGVNSVLSNYGDKVWAFSPSSLGDYSSYTEEASYFRASFLADTSQKWYLAPGEVAKPTGWNYQWAPDVQQTTAWTGYKLAADRMKEMDQYLYLQLLKRRDPKAGALVSCAKSASESVTSAQELNDRSTALRKLSAALKATTTGTSCFKAVKDFDAAHPEAAKKVPAWASYAEKAADASPTGTKIAAVFDEMLRFCAHVNMPKLGC